MRQGLAGYMRRRYTSKGGGKKNLGVLVRGVEEKIEVTEKEE